MKLKRILSAVMALAISVSAFAGLATTAFAAEQVYTFAETTVAEGETAEVKDSIDESFEVHLGSGDTIDANGVITWNGTNMKKSDGTTYPTDNRYIVFTPAATGNLTVTFGGDKSRGGKNQPRLYVLQTDDYTQCTKDGGTENIQVTKGNYEAKTYNLAFEGGKTYILYPFNYNQGDTVFQISNITYVTADVEVSFTETTGLEPEVTVYTDADRTTEISVTDLVVGETYYYKAVLSGYKDYTGEFTLENGTAEISFTMEKMILQLLLLTM